MTEAQYKLAKDQERENAVKADKKRIDQALSSNDEATLRATHMDIDGKYGAYIPDWGKSMYVYGEDLGFNYEWLNKDSLIHNLTLMRSRIEGYFLGFERRSNRTYAPNNNVNVNVSNTNEVNVSISFEDVRKQIEDMTSLTDAQTKEALDKVSEIESVVNGTDSKKTKWEKIKPILTWLADKSFDVAMTLLPLLLQVQK
ncbi:MAG: hypothetical protein J6M34_01450 [Clostridia bacterium]|nr:hypothetical protein [Clostridia bacterium]